MSDKDTIEFHYNSTNGLTIGLTIQIDGIEDIASGLESVLNAAGWRVGKLEITELTDA